MNIKFKPLEEFEKYKVSYLLSNSIKEDLIVGQFVDNSNNGHALVTSTKDCRLVWATFDSLIHEEMINTLYVYCNDDMLILKIKHYILKETSSMIESAKAIINELISNNYKYNLVRRIVNENDIEYAIATNCDEINIKNILTDEMLNSMKVISYNERKFTFEKGMKYDWSYDINSFCKESNYEIVENDISI